MSNTTIPALDVRSFEYILKQRMKADPTFKDYNFEGSGLSAIIRLLAMDTNTQAFMNNMTFGEGHLQSAQQRANVAMAAQFLSYTPYNKRAAVITVNLVVTPYDVATAPSQLVLDRRAAFVGVKDGKSFNFTVDDPIVGTLDPVEGVFKFTNVRLVQGNWMSKTYTVEGSAISSYAIPSPAVDINHIHVKVQLDNTNDTFTTFEKYNSPFDLGQYSNIFFVEMGFDQLYNIEFGDGYIARRVNDGNLVYIQYLMTEGLLGNDITSLTPAASIGGFSKIDITLVDERSKGGQNEEDIESIKRMAPLAFQAEGAAVAESDYAEVVERLFSSVHRARAYGGEKLPLPSPGYVYIAVIPVVGDTLTDAEKAEIEATLDKYNVGSITPKIVDADPYYVDINTTVSWDPTATALRDDQIKTTVIDGVVAWGKDRLEGFSEIFDKEILEYAIKDMDKSIVSNITTVVYRKTFEPTPGIMESHQISFSRQIRPTTVMVTGFKPIPAEVDYTYLIKDDGNGNLNMHKTNGTNVFIVSAAGTVDYKTGLVSVDKLNVSRFDEGGVMVSVAPDGLDQNFVTQNNQILRIGSVVVNTEVRYVQRS